MTFRPDSGVVATASFALNRTGSSRDAGSPEAARVDASRRLVPEPANTHSATLLETRKTGIGGASEGEVVGLGATAREHDLGWVPSDKRGRVGPGLVDGRLGLLAKVVEARRIAEDLAADPDDGLDGFGGHWSRGVVVKVDTHL